MRDDPSGVYPTEGIRDVQVTYFVWENKGPSSWSFRYENTAFILEVNEGAGVFAFKYPLPSLEAAERVADEFLRSWAGEMLLQTGPTYREFRMTGSRAPGHGGRVFAVGSVSISGPQAEANTRLQEPWRRHPYWHQPLVRSLISRYESYRRGRESLAVVGYLSVTALERAFGSRKALRQALNIDERVLHKLTGLVSTVGTLETARKIEKPGVHQDRELSATEQFWIETVLRHLLMRAGEASDGRSPGTLLSLADLPPL